MLGLGWDGSHPLPAGSWQNRAPNTVALAGKEGLDSCLLHSHLQGGEVCSEINRKVHPERSPVVGIFKQMDLRAILGREEPPLTSELRCQLRARCHPAVAENIEKEDLFGLSPPAETPSATLFKRATSGAYYR